MKYLGFLVTAILLLATNLSSQTIYEIQGQNTSSPFDGQIVSSSGIVTATFSSGYFIQDGDSAWTGIYVYDNTNFPANGDSIAITGEVSEYYELTEIKNISSYSLLSSGNQLPEPILLPTGSLDESFEGVLIKVGNANCTNPDLGFGEWELDDGSGPCVIDDLGYAFSPIAGTAYSVTGPLHFSYDFYKIEPRNSDDVNIDAPLYFTVSPAQNNIQTNSFSISWETNIAATSEIIYGYTPMLELGEIIDTNMLEQHELIINNLQAADIIYLKAYSVAGSDTTPCTSNVYATISNSSGEIKVYFNHSVDTSVSTGTNAVFADNSITDTIISYIEKAQNTLDITMYDVESPEIISAINDAHNRGVNIRYITDDEPVNEILDSLNTAINILRGNENAIMHDKFIIIDVESVDSSWLITGSTNHTYANLGWDFNNMICIQDQSLAKAYKLEFNEMWGSETLAPDTTISKFGSLKSDNTPHKFIIDNIPVELYFSPSDNTNEVIKNLIDNTENEIELAMLVFTENSLGTAMKNAYDRGVNIRGIIDYVESTGSEFDYLISNGLNIIDYQNENGTQWPDGPTLHHKYAIFDFDSQNPVLLTGSHNWSASAESKNDENTLVIFDESLANQFHQEFTKRFDEQLSLYAPIEEKLYFSVSIFPNPNNGEFKLNVKSTKNQAIKLSIYDTYGKNIENFNYRIYKGNNSFNLNINKNKGMLLLNFLSENGNYSTKVIVN
ncbi:MAG: T9SS type A sorting domain-containing protein [Bacteroidetes bacterium]|jgi:phosphatidylserine/phosphatidylglycerophosphate/cardiolipin synthase-like enzyme|nr:T9SS type A sorting domain-containing protein [Bacteroidota bacterium]MBT6687686.1 T9SS type A sorting domain-containing protein [Bacteroidota bacterium]MBT7142506.1 T9SS type A sorting domain-containing protein [Bacteroidota bacterium]MBT7493455.1 T9SS type A sorting domain-containing protein [Bacteroidota bacterium]